MAHTYSEKEQIRESAKQKLLAGCSDKDVARWLLSKASEDGMKNPWPVIRRIREELGWE